MEGLISRLSRNHEVGILAFKRPGAGLVVETEATSRYASKIVTVDNPSYGFSPLQRRAMQARSLVSRVSYEQLTYRVPQFQGAFDSLISTWKPDVVVVEFAQMGFIQIRPGIGTVLDAHNVEHEVLQRAAAINGSLFRRVYSRRNGAKLREDEARLLDRVDAVAATSETDQQALLALAPDAEIRVVPNGVATDVFAPIQSTAREPTLLYFGAMDYFPNSDAVLYFRREIWPALSARYPELRFAIVEESLQPPCARLLLIPGSTFWERWRICALG